MQPGGPAVDGSTPRSPFVGAVGPRPHSFLFREAPRPLVVRQNEEEQNPNQPVDAAPLKAGLQGVQEARLQDAMPPLEGLRPRRDVVGSGRKRVRILGPDARKGSRFWA